MGELTRKVDQMENQSRRENLIFHNIPESEDESWEQCETKVRRFISEELELDEIRMSVERAHRLNTNSSPKPVIMKFSRFKDKDKVLRTYREKVKAHRERQEQNDEGASANADATEDGRDTETLFGGIRVAEDFSPRVHKARAKLRPFLRDFIKAKRNAFIKFYKLVVDDVTYVYSDAEEKLVPE